MALTANDPSTEPQPTVTTESQFGPGDKGLRDYYLAEIQASNKEMEEWRKRAARVVKRYRDERNETALGPSTKRYNLLWSIINTTMPAIYGKPPKPIVGRRYMDPDQVARVSSIMLERVLDFQLATQSEFHPGIRHVLQDRLLPGMGCVWVRYQKGQDSPTGTVDNDYYARLAGNLAAVDYVYWEDFGYTPARTWAEVPLVWRRVYLTKDEVIARFSDKIAETLNYDHIPAQYATSTGSTAVTDEPKNTVFKRATVYEMWDKRKSRVIWISSGYPTPLDQKDDFMHFPGFFPCPPPLFATNTTGNLTPVPDYCMYQDQANEIDTITQRLDRLMAALKVVGVYDASQQDLQRMLTEGVENQLIPVDTWAAFAEKGGIKGTIDWLPLEQVSTVTQQLFEIRQQLIQDIYQITGLSDIIRGASNPNETLGAQKIKAQFASIRLDDLRGDLARFVTDTLQLMAHVVVEFFDDQTIIDQSAILQSPDGQEAIKSAQEAQLADQPPMPQMPPPMPPPGGAPGGMVPPASPLPPPQQGGGNVVPFPTPAPPAQKGIIEQALALLRKGRMADFRVEVQSDSMVEPDLEAERDARNQFITGITQFLQQALPATQQNPKLAPIMQALLMFGIRGFRVGRDIEGVIDSAFTEMRNNPQPPPADPKADALKMKAQIDQQKAQSDQQAQQMEMQMEQQKMQMEMQKMQAEMQMQKDKLAAEIDAIHQKAEADVEAILIKANVTAQVAQQKAASDAALQSQKQQVDVAARAQELDMQAQEHQQTLDQTAQSHEMGLEQQKEVADASLEQQESAAKQKAEGENGA